uniref:Ricin B-type lectin domain-containing protein n=1 Tax=Macrostomum lignano TaxID=282301 RepID=A0A1I8F4X2_9PLAT
RSWLTSGPQGFTMRALSLSYPPQSDWLAKKIGMVAAPLLGSCYPLQRQFSLSNCPLHPTTGIAASSTKAMAARMYLMWAVSLMPYTRATVTIDGVPGLHQGQQFFHSGTALASADNCQWHLTSGGQLVETDISNQKFHLLGSGDNVRWSALRTEAHTASECVWTFAVDCKPVLNEEEESTDLAGTSPANPTTSTAYMEPETSTASIEATAHWRRRQCHRLCHTFTEF